MVFGIRSVIYSACSLSFLLSVVLCLFVLKIPNLVFSLDISFAPFSFFFFVGYQDYVNVMSLTWSHSSWVFCSVYLPLLAVLTFSAFCFVLDNLLCNSFEFTLELFQSISSTPLAYFSFVFDNILEFSFFFLWLKIYGWNISVSYRTEETEPSSILFQLGRLSHYSL